MTIKGFEECSQCGAQHRPVSGICGFKLQKDATFVLHACGRPLSLDMVGRVLCELVTAEGHRYVSSPVQREAYLQAGASLKRVASGPETAEDGAEWVTRHNYPDDVLLIETSGGFGLIKTLKATEG